jgi:PIN domain nuclease of toxin-antitoxin system
MKALLDTHTFLWWIGASASLSPKVRDLILSGDHEIYLSAATIWEIAIKAHKGRITLPDALENMIAKAQSYYHFSILPIQVSHACQVISLPDHHNDPFDRLLIAQCQVESMSLLSADKIIPKYDLNVIWD